MALVFLAHFTHHDFDYILDLDVISFNALLDAATRLDASRWIQRAWLARAAAHAEGKEFQKMVKKSWGSMLEGDDEAPEAQTGGKSSRGFRDLIRDFGKGM